MESNWAIKILLLGVVIASTIIDGQTATLSEKAATAKQILEETLPKYTKGIRPNYGEKATEVGVSAYILSVNYFCDKNQEFEVTLFLRQQWDDPRLAFPWQGRSYIRPEYIQLEPEHAQQIWKPDTYIINSKKTRIHEDITKNEFTRVYSNGTILTSVRLSVQASCPLDLKYFPFDTQTCKIEIESFGRNLQDINYYWAKDEDSLGFSDNSNGFSTMTVSGFRPDSEEVSFTTGNHRRLRIIINFRRLSLHYVIRIYFPMISIVTISMLTLLFANPFLEPLIHVITISVLIWHSNVAWIEKLPALSYVTSLSIYFAVCLIHLLLALFASLASSFRYFRQMQENADGICSICKPLTELDNYRGGTNSRRAVPQQKSRFSCNLGSVLLCTLKLIIITLFVGCNILYWIFYRYLTNAANQQMSM